MDKEKEFPKHIAIIMDGNGRWAKKRLLPKNQGHSKGATRLKQIAFHCNDIGLKFLTVYAFSTENWSRPKEEVDYLMKMPIEYFKNNFEEFNKKNIRIKFIGTKEKLSNELIKVIDDVEEKSQSNTGLTLIIAFNYGSRNELCEAVKEIIKENIDARGITEEVINKHLYTKDIPDVDLMIRTSGEMRLSNFLLWQNSYSEFFFVKTLWPDFTAKELDSIIDKYMHRDRRFGGRNND